MKLNEYASTRNTWGGVNTPKTVQKSIPVDRIYDDGMWRSGILRGMVRFVALYQGEYDPERLVKRLQTIHPMTLVRDEKAMSGTVSYKYMMLILRTYNGSSRSRSLPIKQ